MWINKGLTGFDLAGPEQEFPDALAHAGAFYVAREGGLGITIHAGEWGGAAQVRRALAVSPARIAHGSRAADYAPLMAELRTREITLDLCPTSNVQASIYHSLADFPLPRLLSANVPVTLSTDDRTVSDLTLVREYERAHSVIGVQIAELWQMNLHALEVAFLHDDEPLRARLIDEFETFAASEPELQP
jgi:adenosine deaminase